MAFKTEYVRVAVTLDNDSLAIMSFVTLGRGPELPRGAEWVKPGISNIWKREPTQANLFAEISRAFAVGPQPVRFRLIQESDIPKDRTNRNAWRDDGHSIVEGLKPSG